MTDMSCFNSVCVKVERRSKNLGAPLQRLFMQSFEVIPETHVPYQQIIDTFRILFGSDVLITLSSELITYKNKLIMKNKTIRVILEIVKLVATALLGYFSNGTLL